VRFDFLDRRSAERFAELLDETTAGPRHHSRGPADEQLAELVAIGHSLSATRTGTRVDPEFRAGLRAMLVATAERDGIGRTAVAPEPERAPGRGVAAHPVTARAGGLLGRGGRRIRARGAIVIGVAAGAMAVSGISAASENASPGDALYGVKRSTERAQLAMAGSDVTRGQLSLDFARTRLAEAAAMPGGDTGFAGVLDDMDADTRKGVKLLTTSAVARRDVKPLATVDTFATRQQRTITPVLGKLTATDRERAEKSLALLDDVHQRADDLRTGLQCTPLRPAGSDTLGPRLRGCADQAGDSGGTDREPSRTGKTATRSGKESVKTKPLHSATPAASEVSSGASGSGRPSTNASTSAEVAPRDDRSPSVETDEPVDPSSGDDTGNDTGNDKDGGLGGLLGGIFGGN
jgi:uncharacterized protein DUF5667